MRLVMLVCLLTTLTSVAVACGSSDSKKVNEPAGGGAGTSGSPGGGAKSAAGEASGDSAGREAVGGQANASGAGSLGGGRSDGGANGELGGGAGLGGAGCDSAASALAKQLQGSWLICGALATNGRIWNGLLRFDSGLRTCAGPELNGTFHWLTTNNGTSEGNTRFSGSQDSETNVITLQEYEVTGGNVVQATDTMKYDPDSDTLIAGAWTCSCSPGSWTSAARVADGTDVDSCP